MSPNKPHVPLKYSGAARKYKLHPVVLRIFPLPTTTEIERTKARLALYKRHGVIEAVGDLIVTGFVEFSACRELGIAPKVTSIAEPIDVIEYIVRSNLPPADYDDNARGCIGVLANKAACKASGHHRMREGGSRGGKNKGKARAESARAFGGAGPRWFQLAAKIVGVAPWLVRTLDRLLSVAPDMFEAVRAKRIDKPHRAHEFARKLPDPADREIVLRRYEASVQAKTKVRLLDLAFEHVRERARAGRPAGLPAGKTYVVYTGSMQEHADKIPDASADIVFADIPYGHPDIAEEAAKIAAKKLVPGGFFVLMCGHKRYLESVSAAARHVTPLDAVGFFDLQGGSGGAPRVQRPMQRVDADPVFFFVPKGTQPNRKIALLKYRSAILDKSFHTWGKPLDAMKSLLASLLRKGSKGAIVVDPCCGGGATGEVALRLGCTFVGVDIDPQATKDTAVRLSETERELAAGEVPRRLIDAGREVAAPESGPRLTRVRTTPMPAPSRPRLAHAKGEERTKSSPGRRRSA